MSVKKKGWGAPERDSGGKKGGREQKGETFLSPSEEKVG